jgi:hypothetical protein
MKQHRIYLSVMLLFLFLFIAHAQSLFGLQSDSREHLKNLKAIQRTTPRIICPSVIESDGYLPVIYTLHDDSGMFSRFYSDEIGIISEIFPNVPVLKVNCGSGSALLPFTSEDNFEISINGTTRAIIVRNNWPINYYEGEITESEVWDDSSIRHITNDLIIAEGVTIEIEAGCKVKIDAEINIIVHGRIIVNGTEESPVFFTNAEQGNPWGGIRLSNQDQKSSFHNTIFTGGGGNDDFIFGHSESQPVVYSFVSDVDFFQCFFIDNVGKGIGGVACHISIIKCIFNRCDMGAEFQSCVVTVDQSHFSEIPDGDGIPADDDNDCLYFYHFMGSMPDTPSKVSNSVFCIGEDDAIDHNEAKLIVENCFISGFENEGIAASAGNYVSVSNSLIMDCEQGIEAGYGSPEVFVDHCVVVNCDVGIRFGDSYTSGCTGQMFIENTILYDNPDNIRNFDFLTQDSVANAIMISYSITNDDHYDNYPHCFPATPLFLPDYYLEENSPGVNQGADGCDIGLYRCNTGMHDFAPQHSDFKVFPNPCSNLLKIMGSSLAQNEIEINIYNLNGMNLFNKKFPAGNTLIGIDLFSVLTERGIYFIRIENASIHPAWHKVIFLK